MRHHLVIDLDRRDGALLRVLTLVERRGFSLQQVDATVLATVEHTPTQPTPRIALIVEGASPVDVLVRQLQRLVDVRRAHIDPTTHFH